MIAVCFTCMSLFFFFGISLAEIPNDKTDLVQRYTIIYYLPSRDADWTKEHQFQT
jgi:hypothetical protein